MSRLVALYPRAWRARYEGEFLALLAERRQGPRDSFDIVRGAVDAHLHPDWPPAPERPARSRAQVATALAAIVGGIGWLAWVALLLAFFRGWDAGEPEIAPLGRILAFIVGTSMVAAIVGIAVKFEPVMSSTGLIASTIAAVSIGFSAFGGGVIQLIGLGALAVMAATISGKAIPRWLAIFWIASNVVAGVAMVAFVGSNGKDVALLALLAPHAVAWVLVGIAIAVRRPPFVDSRASA